MHEKGKVLMLKVSILASAIAALAMGANVSVASTIKAENRDAQIIVEVNRDQNTLTEKGITNTQNMVMNNIRKYVTSNFKVVSKYSHIANAFAISVNSSYIEKIKQVPGVNSVTLNEIHWETKIDEETSSRGGGIVEDEYGGSKNISAETMKKPGATEELPGSTNDGEGTVIAILDNEFYLRGIADDNNKAWNHETYTALDSSVALKFKSRPEAYAKTHAYTNNASSAKVDPADLGKEGSFYFNSKVPFYFDYGGEKTSYAADYSEDFDVSSELSYHGSHVASIASGNAPTYKGIAPKAQLVCMKVFTNYKASAVDKLLGLSSSSGAYDIPILNALEDCLVLGVDGINMSLGSNLNDFDAQSITVKKLNELADSGILTSISAGNSGKTSYATTGGYANWTKDMVETGILSGYANAKNAMTIASGQPLEVFYENAFNLGDNVVAYDDQIVNRDYGDADYDKEYKMSDLVSSEEQKLQWVYVPGFGAAGDYDGIEVSGRIAVVNRGSTSFADKYVTAKGKGAIALIIINNDPTSNDFNFRMSFGDDFRPSMPCCLVLYKDRSLFANAPVKEGDKSPCGEFTILSKKISENPNALSVSTFSTDGATFDLDLKPEITAPGDLIKGAVPPQKNEDRTEDRKYKVYEFLSGTSMSAPNFAGAQSVILSKAAAPIYQQESQSAADIASLEIFRKTVNMRLMSTAEPMNDLKENPETNVISVTSPRKQGAGMANIGAAYNTEVYLEGLNENGKGIGKSKINLRNNAKINSGVVALSFLAHNEGASAHSYNVSVSIMRPAIANSNETVSKEYNDRGSIDSVSALPGFVYYEVEGIGEQAHAVRRVASGAAKHFDVYKMSRDTTYYATAEDAMAGIETPFLQGNYYNPGVDYDPTATSPVLPNWTVLPGKDYQSVYDVEIAKVDLGSITVPANTDAKIDLAEQSLSAEAKQEIANFFDYGCYIEGYVTLTSTDNQPQLSIPYMGFCAGEGKDYGDAPVVEPFSFEKNSSTVYPSDLVNDIGKSLLGKDRIDMGSMMVTGHLKEGQGINKEAVLANDDNLANLSGFSLVGTDPGNGEYYENASENIYLGNTNFSNTLVIQQFVLRSVANNYYTITNNKTGKVAYKSALEDMLFGEEFGIYPLYKSHIDDNYLGAGYIAHRAYGVVPLYDQRSGKPFESGDYELKFNYLLAATGEWVSKTYTLHIDSDAPEVSSIKTNEDNVRINIKESNLVYAVVDRYTKSFTKDKDGSYYIDITKAELESYLLSNYNANQGSGRLYINLVDAARGQMGCIVRFDIDDNGGYNFSKYVMVEHYSLTRTNDFQDDGKNITIVEYNSKTYVETPITINDYVLVSRGAVKYVQPSKGCSGNVATTSVTLTILATISILGLGIAALRRKRKLGGKN